MSSAGMPHQHASTFPARQDGKRDGTLPIRHTGKGLRSLHQSWLPFHADWVCAGCCHRGKGACIAGSRLGVHNGD